MSENLNLRLIDRTELHKLRKFYKLEGSLRDPKGLFTAAVAELPDETIVGMLGFELIPHLGPLYVMPNYRNNGIAVQLYQAIEVELDKKPGTGYYTFPSNEASKRVMEKLGLTKLPWEVWKREF